MAEPEPTCENGHQQGEENRRKDDDTSARTAFMGASPILT